MLYVHLVYIVIHLCQVNLVIIVVIPIWEVYLIHFGFTIILMFVGFVVIFLDLRYSIIRGLITGIFYPMMTFI